MWFRDEDEYYADDINDAIEQAELEEGELDDDYDEDEVAANAASDWENSRGQ